MSADRETVIKDILSYIDKNLGDPRTSWPEKFYKERIYMRTAAYELVESIMSSPTRSVEDILFFKVMEYERMMRLDLPSSVKMIIKDYLLIYQLFFEKWGDTE